MKIHAVFVVAQDQDGNWAATTRPNDPGKIGLPGGKVDEGETPEQAVIREAREEGWDVDPLGLGVVHYQEVDGDPVLYFASPLPASKRKYWVEMGRVEPIAVKYKKLVESGMGNDRAAPNAKKFIDSHSPKFTVEEIADYISGWVAAPYESVLEVGETVLSNALNQLRDYQDGIEAYTERKKLYEGKND